MAVFTVMYVKTQKEYRHSERDIAAVMEIRGAISPALTINEKSRLDEASLRAAEYESAQERPGRLQASEGDQSGCGGMDHDCGNTH